MKLFLVAPGKKGGANILGRSMLAPLSLMYLAASTPGEVSVRIIDESVERLDCSGCLSSFKRPREVRIVDALPKSIIGKVLKRELIRIYEEE